VSRSHVTMLRIFIFNVQFPSCWFFEWKKLLKLFSMSQERLQPCDWSRDQETSKDKRNWRNYARRTVHHLGCRRLVHRHWTSGQDIHKPLLIDDYSDIKLDRFKEQMATIIFKLGHNNDFSYCFRVVMIIWNQKVFLPPIFTLKK